MGRGSDLGYFAQHRNVGGTVVEVVVSHEATVGFAADQSEFLFVELLEDRALIPGGTLEFLQGLAEILLGDVQDTDFEHLVGFGVVDQMMQTAPGAFELLEIFVVDDLVDLIAQFLVDFGDDPFDGFNRII